MNEIVIALIGLSGTIVIAVLGLYGARKYNIGPNQDKLVSTLKDIAAAQATRITQLETTVKSHDELLQQRDRRISELDLDQKRLQQIIMNQMVRIQELELQAERKG
jgi:hypothetical protein